MLRAVDTDDGDGATTPTPCPFCEIVAGRRPQEIVYADDTVVGFLCEPPATWGHVLVVPRLHRADIWDIRPEEAAAAFVAARLLATVVRDDLGAVGVNLRQNSGSKAGQDVFHFHLHVVPRYADDTLLPGRGGRPVIAGRNAVSLARTRSPVRHRRTRRLDALQWLGKYRLELELLRVCLARHLPIVAYMSTRSLHAVSV